MSGDELLACSLDAHGSLERWQQLEKIGVDLVTGGLALAAHGQREIRTHAVVSTREPRVALSPYRQWPRAVFERDRVFIEDVRGSVLAERMHARAHMGRGRRALWWDCLDALYFVGYALSTYLRAPFLFAQEGFLVETAGTITLNGDRWQRLRVTFPPDEPTHCRTQLYYLDSRALIRRLDYVAEPIGRWAHAAHFCADYREFLGLRMATRRWVRPRGPGGTVWPWPRLVSIRIDSAELVHRRGSASC